MTTRTYRHVVQVDVLGPLRVTTARGPAELPGGRSAALVCWLTMHANRSMPVEWLTSSLWDHPPPSAVQKTRMLVRGLVPLLDPGALELDASVRLVLDEEAVDAWRFRRLLDESDACLAGGDRPRASANLQAALDLWRGDAYTELQRDVGALGEIGQLNDLRLHAVESQIGISLTGAVGYPLVADLQSFVVLHADRPRLRLQLALALYRTDRQVEALDVLRATRRDLGDPHGGTARLQAAILTHDPALSAGELPEDTQPPVRLQGDRAGSESA